MLIKKYKVYNYKSKNYVWKKNDFSPFFDEYSLYNNLLYTKYKKNLMFKYFGNKIKYAFKSNINFTLIYKNYRKYCLKKKNEKKSYSN